MITEEWRITGTRIKSLTRYEEAAKAFIGDNAELFGNTLYQDQRSNCK
jgi:hypothetical protein